MLRCLEVIVRFIRKKKKIFKILIVFILLCSLIGIIIYVNYNTKSSNNGNGGSGGGNGLGNNQTCLYNYAHGGYVGPAPVPNLNCDVIHEQYPTLSCGELISGKNQWKYQFDCTGCQFSCSTPIPKGTNGGQCRGGYIGSPGPAPLPCDTGLYCDDSDNKCIPTTPPHFGPAPNSAPPSCPSQTDIHNNKHKQCRMSNGICSKDLKSCAKCNGENVPPGTWGYGCAECKPATLGPHTIGPQCLTKDGTKGGKCTRIKNCAECGDNQVNCAKCNPQTCLSKSPDGKTTCENKQNYSMSPEGNCLPKK